MRLIDADTFKKQIAGMTIANNYPVNKASALCDLIDAQQTAYEVKEKPFWKREKYWNEKFEGYVLNSIVNPIEKMLAEMEESHDGE